MLNPELVGSLPHAWQVPLPIPLPVDVGEPQVYMPLELARLQEFNTRHQPSLISRSQRRTFTASRAGEKPPHRRAQNITGQDYGNKTIKRNTARGFVKCGDCAKPRVIYSDTAPSRMVPLDCDGRVPSLEEEVSCQALVSEALNEACSSTTFVCGANLYDTTHPFREVFITQGTLTCADPIEPHFYTLSSRMRRGITDKVCCFCGEEQDEGLDDELKKLFMTVLPVCQACIADGAKIPVRHAIRNATQRAARVAVDAERKARREAQSSAEVQPPQQEVEVTANATSGRGRGRSNGTRGRGTRRRG
jgi:hypothetical protein